MLHARKILALFLIIFINIQENHGAFHRRAKRLSISQQKCIEYGNQVEDCSFSPNYEIKLTPAQPMEFPHMAILGFNTRDGDKIWSDCEASLISERFLITAYHCTTSSLYGQPHWILLGSQSYLLSDTTEPNSQIIPIAGIIKHPSHNNDSIYNDIALIRLSKAATFTPYVRPACLQTSHHLSTTTLISSGYEISKWGRGTTGDLMKFAVHEYGTDECNYWFDRVSKTKHVIKDQVQICAGYQEGDEEVCEGFGGSPIQIYNEVNKCMYNIVGVLSINKLCHGMQIQMYPPYVYTRISAYLPWIESVVWPTVKKSY